MNDPWWLAGGVLPYECVAAYQPIGAASVEASYINLANPGVYNAAPGVAPTFNARTGWNFNGSQHLTTAIIPAANNNRSLIIRFSDAGPTGVLSGVFDNYPSTRLELIPRDDFFGSRFYANGGYQYTGDSSWAGPGVMAIAGSVGYKDGISDVTGISSSNNTYVDAIPIGARILAGNISLGFVGNIQSWAYYNTTLTAAQVSAITNAINALTGYSLPYHHMPSSGMRRWAMLYVNQQQFIPVTLPRITDYYRRRRS